ncbi:hypothetical protein SOPP22_15470 [Shewanella sp. OPT22]|nr:hypothetical protein SOPP22_15470 [Shewanella sp. OPT22]
MTSVSSASNANTSTVNNVDAPSKNDGVDTSNAMDNVAKKNDKLKKEIEALLQFMTMLLEVSKDQKKDMSLAGKANANAAKHAAVKGAKGSQDLQSEMGSLIKGLMQALSGSAPSAKG